MACKYIYKGKTYTKGEFESFVKENIIKKSPENKFLNLLGNSNNWVTFFVKSIIQDSAKKGYEKVLFPKGDTAAKIEGHQTLEEFKKQKEARIKKLEKITSKEKPISIFGYPKEETAVQEYEDAENEIKQLKQELADVESGQTQLSSIASFYENTVTNILSKQGYNPVEVTDEYSNKWNEISITPKTLSEILLQRNEANEIVGQANIEAGSVLIDALNQKQDTLPHEYAHHYIAWNRNSPIVQEAIKKWGSEENLVQAIGEQAVKQKGEAWNWWKKFVKWLLGDLNKLSKLDKEKLKNILTDAFLGREDLDSIISDNISNTVTTSTNINEEPVDVEYMQEVREYEGENITSSELLNQTLEDTKGVPGARGIEPINEPSKNTPAYNQWLFSPTNKINTKVRIVPTFKWGMNEELFWAGKVPSGKVNLEVQFLDENGNVIEIDGEPVTSEFWGTRRADGGDRENDKESQYLLESQREIIVDKLLKGETVETYIQEQLPADFKETKNANNNIAEVFNTKVKDLKLGVVDNKGNYVNLSDTKLVDSELAGYSSVPKLAGRLYTKLPNNTGTIVPALLNIRHINEAEADLLANLYLEILKDPNNAIKEVSENEWKAFEKIVPNNTQEVLKDIPTYENLINFLVYDNNASKNPEKYLVVDNGTLFFGTQKMNAQQLEANKKPLKDFFKITQRRRVDIKKLSESKSAYRQHIIGDNILSTDIDKGLVKFRRRGKLKGSVYLAPLADPKIKVLEQSEGTIQLKEKNIKPSTKKESSKKTFEKSNEPSKSSEMDLSVFKKEPSKKVKPSNKFRKFGQNIKKPKNDC